MGSFDAILRVRKFELDEQRRDLRRHEEELQILDDQLQHIADEIADVVEGVDAEIAAISTGAFFEGARKRKNQLMQIRNKKEEEVERHRALVAGAYQDLKTIEIAAEREAEREAKELDRKLQAESDELGMQSVVRRQEQSRGR